MSNRDSYEHALNLWKEDFKKFKGTGREFWSEKLALCAGLVLSSTIHLSEDPIFLLAKVLEIYKGELDETL